MKTYTAGEMAKDISGFLPEAEVVIRINGKNYSVNEMACDYIDRRVTIYPDLIKELEFEDTVAFYNCYLDVRYMASMIEPGEIADIKLIDYHEQNGDEAITAAIEDGSYVTRNGVKGEEALVSCIYDQYGDQIIECMNELFSGDTV